MTTLYKHQLDFLRTNPDKSALVWSCGTGKTRTALDWSRLGGTVLVVCPKGLRTNWLREAERWNPGQMVVVMSKETFRKEVKDLPYFDQVIVDEVHNGFLTPHFKSQMSKALRDYLKKNQVTRVLLLSATVYTSSPWNIYQLALYLGYKLDWQKFNYRFFNQIRMGRRFVPVPKKGCEVELAKITKKIASVVNIYDVLDVPLQQHCDPEYFALNKGQQKLIKENYDPLPIVRFTKQHEIENGFITKMSDFSVNIETGIVFDYDKLERIWALVQENPKIAIVCRYTAQINALAEMLKQYSPKIISGQTDDRDKVCQEAENATKSVVIIQSDCGIGFELPSFPVCVFLSMSYSYTSWEQMCGRFLRMNKPSRTTFLYLLTEGKSVDQGIYDAIKRKEDFKIELFK